MLRIPGLFAAAVAGMALAAGLTACGRPTSETGTVVTSAPVTAPLATSIDAAGGTWATLPMGHLNDPLNTFWQLFYRSTGSSVWSDQVQATATATNGGLVLAGAGGRSLLVGVRPSNLLRSSPIIATSDGGRAWANGLAPGLVARPAALADDPTGKALALVGKANTTTVVDSVGDLFTWPRLTSLPDLAAIPSTPSTPSCDPVALGAVGYAGASPVVGTRCARPGVVGLFTEQGGSWQRVGPVVPPSLAGARIDVLSLEPTDAGLAAVLAASGASGTSLLVAWSQDGGVNWAVSPALQLPAGQQLSSIGPAGGNGLFVLISSSSGSGQLAVVDGPGATWHSLAPPPAGTATVAFGPAGSATRPGTIQALVAEDTMLTVWSLGGGATSWVKGQVMQVPIQFGSSS